MQRSYIQARRSAINLHPFADDALAAVQAKKQYACSICTRLKRGGEDDAIALTYPIGLCKEKMQKELGISTVYK